MKSRLPVGLKILLASAYVVCGLAMIECTTIILIQLKFAPNNILSLSLNILLFGLFFLHSLLLIRILQSYYPAGEIPKNTVIAFRIANIISWIAICLFIIGVISMFSNKYADRDFRPALSHPLSATIFISFFSSFVFQMFNVVASIGLIRKIKRNHRQQMFESI